MLSAVYSVIVCLSVCQCVCVCVSVTLRYCIKTAKQGRQMQVGWVKIRHFRRKTRYNTKTVQDRCIVSIKVE